MARIEKATDALISAALALAGSLDWDVTDSGHGVVRCDYDTAGRLQDAAERYRSATGLTDAPAAAAGRKASRGLADLMRRNG